MTLHDRARPFNILLVMADQLRWDALGCVYGGAGAWVRTPNIDRIAGEGIRFANAYTNSPVCVPARVSLATGRYPHNTGVWKNEPYTIAASEQTWMQHVRAAGYRTSVFGKTHLHRHRGDLRDRIDVLNAAGLDDVDEIAGPRAARSCRSNLTDLWEKAGVADAYRSDLDERYENAPWVARPSPLPFELYPDVYVGRQAAEYLRTYDRDQPWMCWVSFAGPHEPWDAPEPYASMYRPEDMPRPLDRFSDRGRRPRGLLDDKLSRPVAFDADDVARLRANYAGNVTLIDEQIGAILEVVAARGELDETIVALVSDHGEMNGDHGLLYKQNFLAASVRIPFVLRVPGARAAGTVSTSPVELMDMGATLIDLARGAALERSHARSVVPVLDDPEHEPRRFAVSELRGETMIADRSWKMVLNRGGRPYVLFDLATDPDESHNLAGVRAHRPTARELRRLLEDWIAKTR